MNDLYLAWNGAIGEWFYGLAQAGRPAYLTVDDDELRDLAAAWGLGGGEPAERLAEGVRAEINRGGGLGRLRVATAMWRRDGAAGEPPYLALLALCVLAGSRMAADPSAGIVAHAYYPHLNRLLRRGVRDGAPGWFASADRLWIDLNRWLEEDCGGRRGLPCARTHPHFTHIGWPLSQCLLRAADRHRLPDFFHWAGLEPGTEIEPAQLWVLFRHWALPGRGLSSQGLRVVGRATDDVAEQISAMLKHELDTWDGDLRDARGRRRGEILLILEKWAGGRRAELRFVARRPDGFPEGEFQLADGRVLRLDSANSEWYRPLDVPVSAATLRHGVTLTREGFSVAYDSGLALPFRACLDPISAWLSCRQANALEEHAVLVHASVLEDARAFLRRYARTGWHELREPAGNVPRGWTVIERVHVSAAPDSVPPYLSSLAPRLYTAMRLEGGLPLDSGIYLTGGEPDLWLTVEAGERCIVDIDGARQALSEGVIELRLADLCLPSGMHEIAAGGVRRRFTTEPGFGLPASRGTASLGHILHRHGTYRPVSEIATALPEAGTPPRGTVHVCGAAPLAAAADLPLGDTPPELLPSGFDEYVVLGAQAGQLLVPLAPQRPAWLERLGLSTWQFFDVPLTFRPKWLIYRGRSGTTRVHRWGDPATEPSREFGGPVSTLEALWARQLVMATEAEPMIDERDVGLWETYVTFAKTMHDEGALA